MLPWQTGQVLLDVHSPPAASTPLGTLHCPNTLRAYSCQAQTLQCTQTAASKEESAVGQPQKQSAKAHSVRPFLKTAATLHVGGLWPIPPIDSEPEPEPGVECGVE